MTKTCVCQELKFSKETMSIIILNMCYIPITFPLLSDLFGHWMESLIITFFFTEGDVHLRDIQTSKLVGPIDIFIILRIKIDIFIICSHILEALWKR